MQELGAGGTGTGTVVQSNGTQNVYGLAIGTLVSSGGSQNALLGGVALASLPLLRLRRVRLKPFGVSHVRRRRVESERERERVLERLRPGGDSPLA